MPTNTAEKVTLFFREGSSDKVYTAELVMGDPGDGWRVNFAYGRRGSTMTTGSKVSSVTYEKAKRVFDKLVAEKTAKGYQPAAGSAPALTASIQVTRPTDTGLRCQLLNEIEESEVERLIQNPNWGMQEKKDGRRQLIKRIGTDIVGINRKGLTVAPVARVRDAVANIVSQKVVIDGEAVGETLWAFDLLYNGKNISELSYLKRYENLCLIAGGGSGAIMVVPLYVTAASKLAEFNRIKAARGEGVVFKRLDAPYKPGRPNTGGDQLKFKFVTMGSFQVLRVNTQRSVGLSVMGDGDLMRDVGNVTIPPNKEVPEVGDIVEVRYLYAFRGGSLYQPVYLVKRDDVDVDACHQDQLKYKQDEEDEDTNSL